MNFTLRPLLVLLLGVITAVAVEPPAPYGPLPSPRQLRWHALEMYAFVHFTTNTFTDKEWGYGDESPRIFNPPAFDAEQIVGTIADAGLKGVMLTCKHHDGFSLWPSAFTNHSVTASPWMDGKGDVVRAISDACRKRGLAFGVYLSPWDRNQAVYGTPEYLTYFRNQLRELLTHYGPIFEVWFDGANGGDGYYGGAREKRSIDNRTYYDWPTTWALVRELQPDACLFSDGGPDVRWVGNESGFAGETCWSTLNAADFLPGIADANLLVHGQRPGTHWLPAEVDVSIRPGWFWHERENNQVKSPANLLKIYMESVGRGANLILNLPPDRRGRLHENDVAALTGWKALLDATFATDLLQGSTVTASNVRGGDAAYAAAHVLDGKRDTYWTPDDGVTTAALVFDCKRAVTFNVVRIREFLPLGQRIEGVAVDIDQNGTWQEIATATSIGNQRLVVTNYFTTSKLRLRITQAAACPVISECAVFAMPLMPDDIIMRWSRDGRVQISTNSVGPRLHYTVDGREPDSTAPVYDKPISLPRGGTVKVRSTLPDGHMSPVVSEIFGLASAAWNMVGPDKTMAQVIDGNPTTTWTATGAAPYHLIIDMGATATLGGITLLPRQDGSHAGTPDHYEVALSADGQKWGTPVASGELSNIRANPVRQVIRFSHPTTGRFLRVTATHTVDGGAAVIAELGVLGQ